MQNTNQAVLDAANMLMKEMESRVGNTGSRVRSVSIKRDHRRNVQVIARGSFYITVNSEQDKDHLVLKEDYVPVSPRKIR